MKNVKKVSILMEKLAFYHFKQKLHFHGNWKMLRLISKMHSSKKSASQIFIACKREIFFWLLLLCNKKIWFGFLLKRNKHTMFNTRQKVGCHILFLRAFTANLSRRLTFRSTDWPLPYAKLAYSVSTIWESENGGNNEY